MSHLNSTRCSDARAAVSYLRDRYGTFSVFKSAGLDNAHLFPPGMNLGTATDPYLGSPDLEAVLISRWRDQQYKYSPDDRQAASRLIHPDIFEAVAGASSEPRGDLISVEDLNAFYC
jgi:hypothetical protein